MARFDIYVERESEERPCPPCTCPTDNAPPPWTAAVAGAIFGAPIGALMLGLAGAILGGIVGAIIGVRLQDQAKKEGYWDKK